MNKQKNKLTPTTIKLIREQEPATKPKGKNPSNRSKNDPEITSRLAPKQPLKENVYIVMQKSEPKPPIPPPPPLIVSDPQPRLQPPPPPLVFPNPPPNTKKKEPTGIIYVSEKKKEVKPAKTNPAYYSSDEEEFADVKKIYKDVSVYFTTCDFTSSNITAHFK